MNLLMFRDAFDFVLHKKVFIVCKCLQGVLSKEQEAQCDG